MESVNIKDQYFQIFGRIIKILRLEEEWMNIIENPETIIESIIDKGLKVDLFTFRQSVIETVPKYTYPVEWEDFAVIPITNYNFWFNNQVCKSVKRAVKKAEKKNVKVRVVDFSDGLVKGITEIFNETPIRQGRPYAHFGKTFDAVKNELSKDAAGCDFIGAYLDNELIGFIQLGHGKGFVIPFGMVSKIEHRDKSAQNALLAEAVRVCEKKGIQYIVYGFWTRGGLGEFKRRNGCIKMAVPRYYIPITFKGRMALKFRFHRGIAHLLPNKLKDRLVWIRSRLYERKYLK